MKKPAYIRLYAESESAEERTELADTEWFAIIADLGERGVDTDQRRRVADRLVRSRVEYEFASREMAVSGAVHTSKDGNTFYNMIAAHMNKHADYCLKYEQALGVNVKDGEANSKPKKIQTVAADKHLAKLQARSN